MRVPRLTLLMSEDTKAKDIYAFEWRKSLPKGSGTTFVPAIDTNEELMDECQALGVDSAILIQPFSRLSNQQRAESLSALLRLPSLKYILIETFDDYIFDRARIEVRIGCLDYRDLRVAWMVGDDDWKVHEITYADKLCNVSGSPPIGFRRWELEERDRTLGFSDRWVVE